MGVVCDIVAFKTKTVKLWKHVHVLRLCEKSYCRNILRVDKNAKKLNTSYNLAYLNYINDKFKDMRLEDTPEEKALIHQEHTYFSEISL